MPPHVKKKRSSRSLSHGPRIYESVRGRLQSPAIQGFYRLEDGTGTVFTLIMYETHMSIPELSPAARLLN